MLRVVGGGWEILIKCFCANFFVNATNEFLSYSSKSNLVLIKLNRFFKKNQFACFYY